MNLWHGKSWTGFEIFQLNRESRWFKQKLIRVVEDLAKCVRKRFSTQWPAYLVSASKLEIRVLHVLEGGAEIVGQIREGRAVELISHPLEVGAGRDAFEASNLAHDRQSSLRQHFRGLLGESSS